MVCGCDVSLYLLKNIMCSELTVKGNQLFAKSANKHYFSGDHARRLVLVHVLRKTKQHVKMPHFRVMAETYSEILIIVYILLYA